ncbi:MAG TPA: Hpt domain-containing protein [Actinomycetota bacterium]|nr:Hpt domain-containing protein [Actinomycetota bacterium]
MPIPDDVVNELRAIFASEAEEHVQALNDGLLLLESGGADASQGAVRELFRAAHTLKGAASAINLDEVERLAHRRSLRGHRRSTGRAGR